MIRLLKTIKSHNQKFAPQIYQRKVASGIKKLKSDLPSHVIRSKHQRRLRLFAHTARQTKPQIARTIEIELNLISRRLAYWLK